MPKMCVVFDHTDWTIPVDISQSDYLMLDMGEIAFSGSNFASFTGTDVYTSDRISGYMDGHRRYDVVLSLKENQSISSLTDFIRLTFGMDPYGGLSIDVYKEDGRSVQSIHTMNAYPWVLFRQSGTNRYGFIGHHYSVDSWGGYLFLGSNNPTTYVTKIYEFAENSAATNITLRCPDSVRRGFHIGIVAEVSGDGDFDRACICEVSGSTSIFTNVTAAESEHPIFILHVGSDEGASVLGVTVTSVANSSLTASKSITVLSDDSGGDGGGDDGGEGGDGGGGGIDSAVTGMLLNVTPEVVVPGRYASVGITVLGTGAYSHEIAAMISGHESANTMLQAGNFISNIWVGADETADYLVFVAASVQNPDVYAYAIINIDQSGSTTETTVESLQRAFMRGLAAGAASEDIAVVSRLTSDSAEAGTDTNDNAVIRAYWQGYVAGAVCQVRHE